MSLFIVTFGAIAQIVLLGLVGFLLWERGVLRQQGLETLSHLVIGVFLPCFIFFKIVSHFTFSLYPNWWFFPLFSFFITAVGYLCGSLALFLNKDFSENRKQFLGIVTFQNSGYLPLPLVAALLAPAAAQEMFIYIFLFLLGFNMTIFSFGFFLLSGKDKFNLKKVLNAPVVAILLALLTVFLKADRILPSLLLRPMEALGVCAIPLSLIVVGANLASLKGKGRMYLKQIGWGLLIKLLILPLIFFALIVLLKPPPLVGLLILLQAAMPPAALLSVIVKSQKEPDHLVSQAIFYGHLFAIVTIPLFLVLYGALSGIVY